MTALSFRVQTLEAITQCEIRWNGSRQLIGIQVPIIEWWNHSQEWVRERVIISINTLQPGASWSSYRTLRNGNEKRFSGMVPESWFTSNSLVITIQIVELRDKLVIASWPISHEMSKLLVQGLKLSKRSKGWWNSAVQLITLQNTVDHP